MSTEVGDFGLCVRSDEHLSPPTTPTTPTTTEKDRSFSVAAGEGRLPIKWLAIECLQYHKFTHKSDIWSYGIVLFEMYSLGESPFYDIDPSDLLDYLLGGGRPPRPLISCDKMYEVMTRCWSENPDERPTFRELLTILAILIEQSTEGYGYLQLIKPSEYKTLTVPDSNDKKRSGTGASNRSGAEKEKEKAEKLPPWKKLAATFKARSVFSPSSNNAAAHPPPPTTSNIPTITIEEPSTSALPDTTSNRIAPDIISRLRSKVSFRQPNELRKDSQSVSNHDLPSTSTETARERAPAFTRSTPKLNLFVNSRILGKNLSAVPQLNNDTPEVSRVKFMPNGYDRTPSPPPVSICIDGHPSPHPLSFPRSRGPTLKSVQMPEIQPENESTSESEEGLDHFGRWSFHRRSALTRRKSMPSRPSMDSRGRSHSLDTTRSNDSGTTSRKISRIS